MRFLVAPLVLASALQGFASGALAETAAPAEAGRAACVELRTPADLNKIRKNLAGNFCLAADIDLASVRNFTPIGREFNLDPFIGTLDGRGHVIRNLKVRSDWVAGFFGAIGGLGGTKLHVKNLGLVNVRIVSTGGFETGGLAGILYDGTVSDVFVTGSVIGEDTSSIGGLFGEQRRGSILRSFSTAAVAARAFGGLIGGLVGFQSEGEIIQSYATGPVTGSGFSFVIAGLVAEAMADIRQSFASGPVSATATYDARVGGLVAYYHPAFQFGETEESILQSFATGPVTYEVGDGGGRVGGLGAVPSGFGGVDQAYAAGRIAVDRPRIVEIGGLLADDCDCPGYIDIRRSYWNTETTGVSRSDGGAPLTTRQFQSRLPNGFSASAWGITPGVSFPYLKLPGLGFWSPLAIVVKDQRLFTFLPISQREESEYSEPVRHPDQASLAAVYAMIARAIGITKSIALLSDALIDDFWDDDQRKASFAGRVTNHAALAPLEGIAPAEPIRGTNVIGPLRSDHMVIIRGVAGSRVHWMLATSFITDPEGRVVRLVANDPWTGRQVQIDPATKRVVAPADFPLRNFTVNGYRVVSLK